MDDVKIYSLSDPCNNEIRYIGKTEQQLKQRLGKHIEYSKKGKSHNACWIKSILKKGLKPKIDLIDTCGVSDWQEIETMYIAQFKGWGFRLTNATIGGEGFDKHSARKYARTKRKTICKYNEEGDLISIYNSLYDAVNENTTSKSSISCALTGKSNSSGGFLWRYYSETKGLKIKPFEIRKMMSAVIQYDLNGNKIKLWESIKEAKEKTNSTKISSVCRGKRKTAGGFKWAYA